MFTTIRTKSSSIVLDPVARTRRLSDTTAHTHDEAHVKTIHPKTKAALSTPKSHKLSQNTANKHEQRSPRMWPDDSTATLEQLL